MSQPPKLLILADLYPPHFAPRVAYLVQHLQQQGYETTIVTEDIPEESRQEGHGKIFSYYNGLEKVHRLSLVQDRASSIQRLYHLLWQTKSKRTWQYLLQHCHPKDFKAVLVFTYRNYPLPVAAKIAKRFHIPVLMDCRDLLEQYSQRDFLPNKQLDKLGIGAIPVAWGLKKLLIAQRNHALRQATEISTVSPWHVELLQKAHPHTPVRLLFNGYDEQVFIPHPHTPQEVFRIVYTGRLLSLEMRNPQLLFQTLSQPVWLQRIQEKKVEIEWYTDAWSKQILTKYLSDLSPELQAANRFLPMVPFEKVPAVLGSASIILLLGNKESPSGPHGMVSTKLFEAMAMHRPILFTTSDKSIVASLLQPYGGACSASTADDIDSFLEAEYQSWATGTQSPAYQKIQPRYTASFSRLHMANQYQAYLETLLKSQ